jgi:hypothetical protein
MPALAEFKRQLKKKREGMRSHLGAARQEREKLKAEISNLASVIADGRQSTALLAGKYGQWFGNETAEIEGFAMKRLRDIQGLLGGDVLRAKSELAKHCTDITLTPKGTATSSAEIGIYWADVRVVPGARFAPRVSWCLTCLSQPDSE